jgi:hypothetical protein
MRMRMMMQDARLCLLNRNVLWALLPVLLLGSGQWPAAASPLSEGLLPAEGPLPCEFYLGETRELNRMAAAPLDGAWGLAHKGVYLYKTGNSSRLMKILPFAEYAKELAANNSQNQVGKHAGNPAGNPAGTVSEDVILARLLKREHDGAIMGEKLGGPKFYGMGRIRMPDGSLTFYIDMEEIFADRASNTMKMVLRDALAGKRDLSELTGPNPLPGQAGYLRRMAELMAEALAAGVLPYDPDFIFSGGDLRWIDTGNWEPDGRRPHPLIPVSEDSPPLQLYRKLQRLDQNAADLFRREFDSSLAALPLSAAEVARLRDLFRLR